MNRRRLLKLADLLEADAKNKKGVKFDIGTWGRSEDGEAPVSVSCGTVACAMGLAVVSGAFKRAGLTNLLDDENPARICPAHKGESGFGAAVSLFDIQYKDAAFLFDGDYYPPSKSTGAVGERFVAKRIRDFVAGKVSA